MNSAQQNYVYLSGWTMLCRGNKQSPIFSGLLRAISLLCNMANMSLLGSSVHWSHSGTQVDEGDTILGHYPNTGTRVCQNREGKLERIMRHSLNASTQMWHILLFTLCWPKCHTATRNFTKAGKYSSPTCPEGEENWEYQWTLSMLQSISGSSHLAW